MRLVVVAHGPTSGLRAMRFGDQSGLEHPELVQPVQRRVRSWYSGPEPACVETARLLGGEPIVVDTLAAPAAGDWAGRTLSEVLDSDPDRVRRWMTDPDGAPPEGESWTGAVQRIGLTVDQLATVVSAGAAGPNPTGVVVLVVSPLAVRAVAAHAIGLGPALVFAVDVEPLAEFSITGSPARWRLRLGS